jgi:hypothetical protein
VVSVVACTAPLTDIRFHGHNTETWGARGISAAGRFKYLCEDERKKWAPLICQLSQEEIFYAIVL